jgi:malate dehydrogenase
MSFIAILGAGATGASLAQRLAARDRISAVRLIDADGQIAQGKALDILQSSAIDGFSTRLSGTDKLEAAAGARVIIVADMARGDAEHANEAALAMLKRLVSMEVGAPLIFAGATQRQLMARVVSELYVPAYRVMGSAPGALESAVRALAALECDGSGVDVQVRVVGVPPRAAVIAWEEATACGQPLGAVVPPHRLAAISARLPSLWPPGPLALASAAARVTEAVISGSRRSLTCFVSLPEPPYRGVVVALPARLGPRGIELVVRPELTRQERTQLENGLALN